MKDITRYNFDQNGRLVKKPDSMHGVKKKDSTRDRIGFKEIPELGSPIGETGSKHKESRRFRHRGLELSREGLVNGIIYSEILGKPVSKRKRQPFQT